MKRRAGILVFSRMSSSRLPGKALLDFGGMPLLAWVIRRARTLPYPVFLATSVDPSDDPLEALAIEEGIAVHRGPLDDVLGRAAGATRRFGLDVIARLCGDRPYFDTDEMARAIVLALDDPTIDLVSNWIPGRTAPGLTTEVISASALARADRLASRPDEREHVTSWFYAAGRELRIEPIESPANELSGRFAVDTAEDLEALLPRRGWSPDVPLPAVSAARSAGGARQGPEAAH
jgi:spore coat polysaccharide biosynthesis protein SpsF (cytidylyltransferase family)